MCLPSALKFWAQVTPSGFCTALKLTNGKKSHFFHLWRTVAPPEAFFKIIKGLDPPSPWSGGVLGVEGGQISCSSGEIFRIPWRTPKKAKKGPFLNFRGGGGRSAVVGCQKKVTFLQRYIQRRPLVNEPKLSLILPYPLGCRAHPSPAILFLFYWSKFCLF